MDLRELIADGEEKAETRTALAKLIGIDYNSLSDAKNGRRGLPVYACVRLAMLLSIDPIKVIAASEAVTEKKPERQEFWKKYAE